MVEPEHSYVDLPEAVGWDRLRRPLWLFDDTTKRHIYANAAALDLWAAPSKEEFLNRDCSDQSDAVRARTRRLLDATAAGQAEQERWTFYPNGQPKTVGILASTHRMPNGQAMLMMEAETLHVDNDHARSLEALRHSPCGIGMIDREGRKIFRNPAAYAAFDHDEVVAERYVNAGAAQTLFDDAWAGTPSTALLLGRTREGERWFHTAARRVTDPATGNDCLLLYSQDVTAQVEAEQALAVAAERAGLAEQRERFLTTLSHEMRTPLTAILGFTELMRQNAADPEHHDMLDRVSTAGRTLLSMVNEMLQEAEGGIVANEAEAPSDNRGEARPLRILYADDHENNRMIVRAMLAPLECVCDLAEDGAQAVEQVQLNEYDLVLMDVQMPVMDGVEATRRIRALPGLRGRAPILALTANTQERQVKRYLAAGMNDCIGKPTGARDLLSKIVEWTASDWRVAEAAVALRD